MEASLAIGLIMLGMTLGALLTFIAQKGHAERRQRTEENRQ
jgi:hypothetical protein